VRAEDDEVGPAGGGHAQDLPSGLSNGDHVADPEAGSRESSRRARDHPFRLPAQALVEGLQLGSGQAGDPVITCRIVTRLAGNVWTIWRLRLLPSLRSIGTRRCANMMGLASKSRAEGRAS
jgi:hypothetical protein